MFLIVSKLFVEYQENTQRQDHKLPDDRKMNFIRKPLYVLIIIYVFIHEMVYDNFYVHIERMRLQLLNKQHNGETNEHGKFYPNEVQVPKVKQRFQFKQKDSFIFLPCVCNQQISIQAARVHMLDGTILSHWLYILMDHQV